MRCVKLVLFSAVALSFNAQAAKRVLVEFENGVHQIVSIVEIPNDSLKKTVVRQLADFTTEIQWEAASQSKRQFIKDPRIVRAPMSKNGKHEVIMLEKGHYVIDVADDADLNNMSVRFKGDAQRLLLDHSQR